MVWDSEPLKQRQILAQKSGRKYHNPHPVQLHDGSTILTNADTGESWMLELEMKGWVAEFIGA